MSTLKMTGKCCICGNTYTYYGNNPWPVKNKDGKDFGENNRCCDNCDNLYVIPARIQRIINKKEDK